MNKIRNSSVLKIISYMLIPFLIGMIIVSSTYIYMKNELGYVENESNSYVETEEFGYNYLNKLISEISTIKHERTYNYVQIEDNLYYRYNDLSDNSSYIKYAIKDKESNKVFTNIQFSKYEEFKDTISANEYYWCYEDNNIYTNLETINANNAKYKRIQSSNGLNIFNGYEVYTYLDKTAFEYSTPYAIMNYIFELFGNNEPKAEEIIPACCIVLIILLVYLLWSIGHKNKNEGISLNSIDKFPYEVLVIIGITGIGICLAILDTVLYNNNLSINLLSSTIQILYFISYGLLAIITITTIKRIKARQFWHSFLVYKIYKKIKEWTLAKTIKVLDKTDTQKKIIIYYIIFIIISSILGLTFFTGIGFILLIIFWIWVLYKILEYIKKLNEIKKALKEIYDGNKSVYIDIENLTGSLKELAIYINDVSSGFSNAVEESLKSERLKAELITNVSHDIKTPLTSIINYVDLIKQENIQDEKIKEYIEVLDKKSQRLKKLTEDLIEASKVSSGNVQINEEEINLKELLKQVIGEFEDNFKDKKLKLELDLPKEDMKIKADNRYMYRIIENLFGNISKYSMKNTRVYITMINTSKKIKIEMKNVSKEKLNISAEELTQRFVRGDKSRYTEGSGLGLSIAKSLTELQNGTFEIQIDGDLFKVTLEWNLL